MIRTRKAKATNNRKALKKLANVLVCQFGKTRMQARSIVKRWFGIRLSKTYLNALHKTPKHYFYFSKLQGTSNGHQTTIEP